VRYRRSICRAHAAAAARCCVPLVLLALYYGGGSSAQKRLVNCRVHGAYPALRFIGHRRAAACTACAARRCSGENRINVLVAISAAREAIRAALGGCVSAGAGIAAGASSAHQRAVASSFSVSTSRGASAPHRENIGTRHGGNEDIGRRAAEGGALLRCCKHRRISKTVAASCSLGVMKANHRHRGKPRAAARAGGIKSAQARTGALSAGIPLRISARARGVTKIENVYARWRGLSLRERVSCSSGIGAQRLRIAQHRNDRKSVNCARTVCRAFMARGVCIKKRALFLQLFAACYLAWRVTKYAIQNRALQKSSAAAESGEELLQRSRQQAEERAAWSGKMFLSHLPRLTSAHQRQHRARRAASGQSENICSAETSAGGRWAISRGERSWGGRPAHAHLYTPLPPSHICETQCAHLFASR